MVARDADATLDRTPTVPTDLTPLDLAGLHWKTRQVSRPEMPSSLILMTSPSHVDCGYWSLAEASLWMCTLVASGSARLRMLSTRWKNTPFTTSQSKDRGRHTGFYCIARGELGPVARHHWWKQAMGLSSSDPGVDEHLLLCEMLGHGTQYDQLFRTWLWAKRCHDGFSCGKNALLRRCVRAGQTSLSGRISTKGKRAGRPRVGKWVASQRAEEASILKERRKGREERELVAAASDPGGRNHRKPKWRGHLEAVVHLVHGFFVTSSGTDLPDLLLLPTGIGFLPGFEHVKEKMWLRSWVDAIASLPN